VSFETKYVRTADDTYIAYQAIGSGPVDFVMDFHAFAGNVDLIWDAVKIISTKDGDQDIRPKTDAEWIAVRNAAVTVAESGNLLMIVPRAKDGGEWMQRAQEMIKAGEEAMRAADSKNAEKLFTVGGDLYDSCSNCHRKYLDAIVNANK